MEPNSGVLSKEMPQRSWLDAMFGAWVKRVFVFSGRWPGNPLLEVAEFVQQMGWVNGPLDHPRFWMHLGRRSVSFGREPDFRVVQRETSKQHRHFGGGEGPRKKTKDEPPLPGVCGSPKKRRATHGWPPKVASLLLFAARCWADSGEAPPAVTQKVPSAAELQNSFPLPYALRRSENRNAEARKPQGKNRRLHRMSPLDTIMTSSRL